MAVYLIGTYDITDQESYQPYVPAVTALLQKHNAEVLAADFAPQTI